MLAILIGGLPACRAGPAPAAPGGGWTAAPCSATLLVGGRVRPGFREGDSPAEALGIAPDGSVAVVGSAADVRASACPGAREIDLAGSVAIPGLVDAHGHVLSLGLSMRRADLRGSASIAEAAERAARFASERGLLERAGAWILGRGWDQNLWTDAALPDRSALDARLGARPVFLVRVDGHAAWVSTEALRIAGIDASTADPEGGVIVRRPDGEPTGVLIDNAVELVEARVPEPTPGERREAMAEALGCLAALGLTSVHDMGVGIDDLPVYGALAAGDGLPLRVVAYLDGTKPLTGADDALRARSSAGSGPGAHRPPWEVAGVKVFADGALGSRGALLLADYSDDPGNRGIEVMDVDRMIAAGREAAALGLAIAIHAIGDAGCRNALDTIERLASEGKIVGRSRIEHVQVLAPEDLPRFAALGAIASVQPVHATSDMPWAEERLGPDRVRLAYAWRSLAGAGATLAFGTDFPVEDPNPLATLRAASTRRDATGRPAGGWHPEQCVTLREALDAMTRGAACAAGAEATRGRLEPGMRADVTVLDRDPLETPPEEIETLRATMTIVDGVVRFRR